MKSKRAREAVVADEGKPEVHQAEEQPAKKRKRDNEDAEATGSGKKSKKDKKDKKKDRESRKDKKDKRKDLLNLPGDDVADEEEAVPETEAAEAKKEKKEKKDKKEKKEKKEKKDKSQKEGKDETTETTEVKEAKKDKKEKKDKKPKTNGETAQPTTNGISSTAAAPAAGAEGIDLDSTTAAKPDRHIVFVGNLPFSATAASISAHFASLSPIAVRCLTNKGDKNPCKGIAFVEFGSVYHQRTCLDKFHHSTFDDGSAIGRKINVELTAGGGGKTKHRQEKIREKNLKLDENRAKRIEKEKNTKEAGAQNGTAAPAAATPYQPNEDHMHPSRRARVPGLGH